MNRFHKELRELIDTNQYDYIILDGFLLYADEKLNHLIDKKYFIYLNKDECVRRRASRNYKSIDTPNYFEQCVWIEYQNYKANCEKSYNDIVYLNGSKKIDDTFKFILQEIKNLSRKKRDSQYSLGISPYKIKSIYKYEKISKLIKKTDLFNQISTRFRIYNGEM